MTVIVLLVSTIVLIIIIVTATLETVVEVDAAKQHPQELH